MQRPGVTVPPPNPTLRKGRQKAVVLASTALSPSTVLRSKADGISSFLSAKGRREMDHRN